jgi:hypothetical protein
MGANFGRPSQNSIGRPQNVSSDSSVFITTVAVIELTIVPLNQKNAPMKTIAKERISAVQNRNF